MGSLSAEVSNSLWLPRTRGKRAQGSPGAGVSGAEAAQVREAAAP